MRLPLSLYAITLALVAAPLSSQNLVTNGDFEGGTNPNGLPKGWTFSGYALAQQLSKVDVTGGGASNSFNCRPGGKQLPTPYPPNNMDQNVVLIQGVVHEFRADIASVANNGNADGGTFEVFVDGVSAGKHLFGRITLQTTERTRLCLRIVPKVSGSKVLRITFHRRYLNTTGTPVCAIDNIFFGRTQGPTVCFPGERLAGTAVNISAFGTAGSRFGIFVSAKNTTPYPISSWTGQWALANPFVPLVIGTLNDTRGEWHLSPSVPASAKGVKIWLQGIQVTTTNLHLGFAQEVNIY